MGIQGVTNSGACTELYQLGLQVVLHFPCQTALPLRVAVGTFGVQVRDRFYCNPLVTPQFL